MNLIQEIKEALAKATPGPWCWHGYAKGKVVDLVTKHSGQITVMAFTRWGMGGAAPAFRRLGAMEKIDAPGMVRYRQSHRENEFMAINHPDAELIANAPTWLQQAVEVIEQAQEEMEIIYTTNEQQEEKITQLLAALSTISDLMADDTSERAQQINKIIASIEP